MFRSIAVFILVASACVYAEEDKMAAAAAAPQADAAAPQAAPAAAAPAGPDPLDNVKCPSDKGDAPPGSRMCSGKNGYKTCLWDGTWKEDTCDEGAVCLSVGWSVLCRLYVLQPGSTIEGNTVRRAGQPAGENVGQADQGETKTVSGNDKQVPEKPKSVPIIETKVPTVPETPKTNPTVPETPKTNPAVPETPKTNPTVPETPKANTQTETKTESTQTQPPAPKPPQEEEEVKGCTGKDGTKVGGGSRFCSGPKTYKTCLWDGTLKEDTCDENADCVEGNGGMWCRLIIRNKAAQEPPKAE